jgi:spermidine synthase
VFKSAQYGNVLVLDGVIQVTERDEFAYHEMLVHVPMFSHPSPRRVLVVGGGDGGVLRELLVHHGDVISEIVIVEIDPMVVEVCQTFFAKTVATHFHDPRVTIIHADAAAFLLPENNNNNKYGPNYWDVIIGDTSDPVGPAESLFKPQFYQSMYEGLNPKGGIVCVQGECFWTQLALVTDILAVCITMFEQAEYFTTMVPTYPCGQIGFIIASRGLAAPSSVSCRIPVRTPSKQQQLRWYSPDMHFAAFCLPPFVVDEIDRATKRATIPATNGECSHSDERVGQRKMPELGDGTAANGGSCELRHSQALESLRLLEPDDDDVAYKCCLSQHVPLARRNTASARHGSTDNGESSWQCNVL